MSKIKQPERDAAAESFLGEDYADSGDYIGDVRAYGLGGDWLILTDEEADELAHENIERDVWAFLPSFLASYMPEGITEDVIEMLQQAKYEDAAPALLSMIGDRFEEFADDAISCDGRGHFLSQWDGCEHEFEYDGRTWYAYRN